jgi:hypothetical protein
MMLIVKSRQSNGYLPQHDIDLPMFKHCTGGFIEVRDIYEFMPVFNAHGIQVMIQDETLSRSNDGSSK